MQFNLNFFFSFFECIEIVIISKNGMEKKRHEDIYIKERNVQLGNVASRVTIGETVTFDQGVKVSVLEVGGVDGCSTAWFPTYIPLI